MCFQKFHDCKYCNSPYPCDEDNYTCPTINHDIDMYMCPSCKDKLEKRLENIDLEEVNLLDINLDKIMKEGDE